eukprot:1827393-Rhodomonas_salina.4
MALRPLIFDTLIRFSQRACYAMSVLTSCDTAGATLRTSTNASLSCFRYYHPPIVLASATRSPVLGKRTLSSYAVCFARFSHGLLAV